MFTLRGQRRIRFGATAAASAFCMALSAHAAMFVTFSSGPQEGIDAAASIWKFGQAGDCGGMKGQYLAMGVSNSGKAANACMADNSPGERCISHVIGGWWLEPFDKRVPCAEIRGEGNDHPEQLIQRVNSMRGRGFLMCAFMMWGFPHGDYSINDISLPYFDRILRIRYKSGQSTLTELKESDGWLGDPTTWDSSPEWPYVAPYAQYKGDKSKAVWLPDEYFAWVWRAYVSRHPTKTKGATHVCCNGMAAPTSVVLESPAHPYDFSKADGRSAPIVNTGTTFTQSVRIQADIAAKVEKLEIYDGNRFLGAKAGNVYGVYSVPGVTMAIPGVRSLIAVAVLKDGTRVTSRPALVFVKGDFYGTVGIETPAQRYRLAPGIVPLPEAAQSTPRVMWTGGNGWYDLAGRACPDPRRAPRPASAWRLVKR